MIPHFSLPFRFTNGVFVQSDQDSLEEVSDCVRAIISTFKGTRTFDPTIGTVDLTFGVQPLNTGEVEADVLDQEPRASVVLSQSPSALDELVAEVQAQVTTKEISP